MIAASVVILVRILISRRYTGHEASVPQLGRCESFCVAVRGILEGRWEAFKKEMSKFGPGPFFLSLSEA